MAFHITDSLWKYFCVSWKFVPSPLPRLSTYAISSHLAGSDEPKRRSKLDTTCTITAYPAESIQEQLELIQPAMARRGTAALLEL